MSGADKSGAAAVHPAPSEIIAKAVEWAKWHKKQNFHQNWTIDHLNTTRHLDSDEQTKSTETRRYKVYPLAGSQFYELIRSDGEPLSPTEQRKEQKEKREFIEKAENKAAGEDVDDEGETDFEFNKELITRYRSEFEGIEEINGRRAYVLRFEPRDGPLPVNRRVDHALNKSHGKLWIDTESFAVMQVEFELKEPVRFWAGILGSLSALRGRLTLTELGGGAWHYKDLHIHMKGRALFRSFHEDRTLDWTNFQPVDDTP